MTEALVGLSQSALAALAAQLGTGHISPPFTELSLPPEVTADRAPVAPELTRLTSEGLSTQHLAYFLNLLAHNHPATDPGFHLVATGPDAPGHPMRDTRMVVYDLFSTAADSVLVAGYAIYDGREVFKALAQRMDDKPGLNVRMFLDVQRPYRDTSASSEILLRFGHRFRTEEWPGSRLPEVFYDPRSLEPDANKRSSLHAKCIVADERTAFVSSANLTEAALERNIEVGVLLRAPALARQLSGYFNALADTGTLQRVPGL